MSTFVLDPRLESSTLPVLDLPVCTVRLSRDSTLPWLVMIPRRAGAVELFDLDPEDRAALMEEIVAVEKALSAATACDKLNVATLGNMVAQLHIHIFARFKGDIYWPDSPIGRGEKIPWEPARRDQLVTRLLEHLSPA